MRTNARRTVAALAALTALGLLAGLLGGCSPSGPGLTNNPPPKGGPPANTRRPPGEIDHPSMR